MTYNAGRQSLCQSSAFINFHGSHEAGYNKRVINSSSFVFTAPLVSMLKIKKQLLCTLQHWLSTKHCTQAKIEIADWTHCSPLSLLYLYDSGCPKGKNNQVKRRREFVGVHSEFLSTTQEPAALSQINTHSIPIRFIFTGFQVFKIGQV